MLYTPQYWLSFCNRNSIFKESVRSDWAKLVKTLNTYTVTACIFYSNRKTGYDDVFVFNRFSVTITET